jgi:hypothetical protein
MKNKTQVIETGLTYFPAAYKIRTGEVEGL